MAASMTPTKQTKHRGRTHLDVRLTPPDRERLERAAATRGLALAAYLRESALAPLKRAEEHEERTGRLVGEAEARLRAELRRLVSAAVETISVAALGAAVQAAGGETTREMRGKFLRDVQELYQSRLAGMEGECRG